MQEQNMNENDVFDIREWNLDVQQLYQDVMNSDPNIEVDEKDFRTLIEYALAPAYRPVNESSVPAVLLIAGLLRLYQSMK
jgi:hypothetical protein